MPRKELHFQSKEAYRKWESYGHMHHKFKHHSALSAYPEVYIRGHEHSVKHSR